MIHVETDPLIFAPDSESWWDVPVSQTSTLESTKAAYRTYADWKKIQRPFVVPVNDPRQLKGARNVSNILVGSAPDSWGVWFPDDPNQTPYTRFLDEVAASGYEWIELGPSVICRPIPGSCPTNSRPAT